MSSDNPKTKKYWRIVELIDWGLKYFSDKGFDNPRREIEWLLTDLLSLSRVDLYLKFDQIVEQKDLFTLRSWIKRRIKFEPVQYITGHTEFYGLPFSVNPNVLIPRPETEIVVETAIGFAKKTGTKHIVDIGTGSGCIAIALAHELDDVNILAVDKSKSALETAQKNSIDNHVNDKIKFQQMDILTDDLPETFDMLVSNPPYVRKDELETLMPDVRSYEPLNALTDGVDGLLFYHRFVKIAQSILKPGGVMILEVGNGDHPQKVANLFKSSNIGGISLHKDLNGDDRVIIVEKP